MRRDQQQGSIGMTRNKHLLPLGGLENGVTEEQLAPITTRSLENDGSSSRGRPSKDMSRELGSVGFPRTGTATHQEAGGSRKRTPLTR
jgi:hypothetical protein